MTRIAAKLVNDRLKQMDDALDIDRIDDEELLGEVDEHQTPNVSKLTKKQIQPKVSINAREMTLNLLKQYSKLIFYADRNLLSIHDPLKDANHKGNEKQVYVEFSSGVFEALKKNMIKTLGNTFEINVIAQPKVEKYGTTKADSKVCFDVKMEVDENIHFVKICAYITKCSMDFSGMNKHQAVKSRADHSPDKRFPHLDNKTVGAYFAENVVPKLVGKIGEKVDFAKVNDIIKELARKALMVENQKKDCTVCEKSLKDKVNFQCQYCSKLAHKSCAIENTTKNANALSQNNFTCKECLFKSPKDREQPKINEVVIGNYRGTELKELEDITTIQDENISIESVSLVTFYMLKTTNP